MPSSASCWPPGATSAPCAFTGNFFGNAGATQTDIVTAIAVDDNGTMATDTDDATVGITDVLPTVRVVKTANPLTMAAPGGTFTFTVVVTNTSVEPITITHPRPTTSTATWPPGPAHLRRPHRHDPGPRRPSTPCTFPGAFTGVAGATQTDIVTVTAHR